MIRELSIDHKIYLYDEFRPPALHADSGDTIIFNATDFVNDLIRDAHTLKSKIIAEGFVRQPCCGDVFIDGAMPGDTLKVTIDKIEITGVTGIIALYPPDFDIYGKYLDEEQLMIVPIVDGKAILFGGKLELPIKPMVGALAVCPHGVIEDTVAPGTYGGNMDCKLLTEGTSIYLPVAVPGALLNMGDVHAIQGDGEIFSALEVASRITVRVELIKGRRQKWPVLETADKWYVIASMDSIDDATWQAMEEAYDFLVRRGGGYSKEEWIVLLGLVGDVEICNVVDSRYSVRLGMPKSVADKIAF